MQLQVCKSSLVLCYFTTYCRSKILPILTFLGVRATTPFIGSLKLPNYKILPILKVVIELLPPLKINACAFPFLATLPKRVTLYIIIPVVVLSTSQSSRCMSIHDCEVFRSTCMHSTVLHRVLYIIMHEVWPDTVWSKHYQPCRSNMRCSSQSILQTWHTKRTYEKRSLYCAGESWPWDEVGESSQYPNEPGKQTRSHTIHY